jgi:hypothetical protein
MASPNLVMNFGTEMPRLADYVAESTQPENDAATIDRAHCFAT